MYLFMLAFFFGFGLWCFNKAIDAWGKKKGKGEDAIIWLLCGLSSLYGIYWAYTAKFL